MFGEESILGQKIVNIDEKNRITLPKFTNVEQDDILLIVNEIDF